MMKCILNICKLVVFKVEIAAGRSSFLERKQQERNFVLTPQW